MGCHSYYLNICYYGITLGISKFEQMNSVINFLKQVNMRVQRNEIYAFNMP